MAETKKLTKEERNLLYRLRRMSPKMSIRRIAKELGRSHSTVLRELERNSSILGRNEDYYTQAQQAHQAAHQRRVAASSGKMRLKSKTIRHYTELHLKEAQRNREGHTTFAF